MKEDGHGLNLEFILDKAYQEKFLNKEEIIFLLSQREEEKIKQIYAAARMMRQKYFGQKIFMYGFIYFSTYCRNNCTFCLYRKENHALTRYRKNETEIMETAASLAASGVHLLDLTMGEDPEILKQHSEGYDQLLHMVRGVKKVSSLPLMISPGVVPSGFLGKLKEAGIDWYALYHETHNRALYAQLRLGQDYERRWQAKKQAHELGMLVEEGLLTGVGDTVDDVADSMFAMKKLGAEQVRVMSFVPQEETPMAHWDSPARIHEMLIIAVMRLLFPDRLIPASLDVDGIKGLQERLAAGANVVTSIIPPKSGLAGVSNNTLDIEDGNRTVPTINRVLEEVDLMPATQQEYHNWVCLSRGAVR
ncbi:methylornithine synthase PylB [Dehalobacterium formicoaceticum]|uniref:Methylornithine synthase PylB n=1 Tax=Dehalobacterium formicoaceticum TaxID=51515 RepID=A0ABT1Y2L3_9FIRM|nr:methylornithine synthase PylB [Dehalobacterium formicoaceticum]